MTLRVFLIEDNPSIRDLLVGMLEDSTPCEVIAVAESQDEALRWLARNGEDWDLLVADLFLAEGSGMEVVKAVVQRLPHQRVVVLTNYAEAANDRALSQGADAVFDKTGQFEDFLAYASDFAANGARSR
ncbi:MAG: response regulator [Pseudomonadota bacterium]